MAIPRVADPAPPEQIHLIPDAVEFRQCAVGLHLRQQSAFHDQASGSHHATTGLEI
jgi:hypothetical protein